LVVKQSQRVGGSEEHEEQEVNEKEMKKSIKMVMIEIERELIMSSGKVFFME